MEEPQKQVYPPGFEPPTDIDVPWYAWIIWPIAIMTTIALLAILLRGFFQIF